MKLSNHFQWTAYHGKQLMTNTMTSTSQQILKESERCTFVLVEDEAANLFAYCQKIWKDWGVCMKKYWFVWTKKQKENFLFWNSYNCKHIALSTKRNKAHFSTFRLINWLTCTEGPVCKRGKKIQKKFEDEKTSQKTWSL